MKVAAFQAPLLPAGSFAAIALMLEQVRQCEALGVSILCCPETILGGLADNSPDPYQFALDVTSGELHDSLRPLSSDSVTTIVGFTERGVGCELFNSAAVFHRGAVSGVYRKHHPAIRRSIYQAGTEAPVFTVAGLTFGILICNDSNHREPAGVMVAHGATALFILTNNGLPPDKADVVAETRRIDVSLATRHGAWVVRADVAGKTAGLISHGSTGVVAPGGNVQAEAAGIESQLLVVELWRGKPV